MAFGRRLAAAHRVLADKGVQELNYNPPLWRLLRTLGLAIKSPHYERFIINLLAI